MKQPIDEILAGLKRIEALLERIADQTAALTTEPTPEDKQVLEALLKRLEPKR